MLILSRKPGEKIYIGDDYTLTLLGLSDQQAVFDVTDGIDSESVSRLQGEGFSLSDDIHIALYQYGDFAAKIAIDAPPSIHIRRDDMKKGKKDDQAPE